MKGALVVMFALALMNVLPGQAHARKRVSTTRPRLERLYTAVEDSAAQLSLPSTLLDSIKLRGYDKPLRSRRESMFVTNATDVSISHIRLKLSYYDMDGRQLHGVEVDIDTDIPAGTTRHISFPSWDTQLTFVYHRSQRSGHGVPYRIKAAVVEAKGNK
ncbi:MAG: hypothetical protein HDR92_08725 [Bacteroides sp.]|nr:hypothetical protein [Bacteroides sp.]